MKAIVIYFLLCVSIALWFDGLVPESVSEIAGESVGKDWVSHKFRQVMIVRMRDGRTVRAVMPKAALLETGKQVVIQERIGSVFGGRTYHFLRYGEVSK